jgi:hypothetical protein
MAPRKTKAVEPAAPVKKKKIIRVRKIEKSPVVHDKTIRNPITINTSNLAANAITSAKIAAGALNSSSITSTHTNFPRVEISPSGVTFFPTTGGEAGTETNRPKRTKKKEKLDYDLDELEKKTEWTTGEAAFYCGMSRTAWHVYMTKHPSALPPVKFGRGRGQQNIYAAQDVRAFKNRPK